MVGGDVADPAHVGGQVINLIYVFGGGEAIRQLAQVSDLEIVGRTGLVFGFFQIGTPNPVSVVLESRDEMVSDEATGAGYENPRFSLQ